MPASVIVNPRVAVHPKQVWAAPEVELCPRAEQQGMRAMKLCSKMTIPNKRRPRRTPETFLCVGWRREHHGSGYW